MPRIMDVKSVAAVILKTNPPRLAVHATGEVPTSGWSHIELQPFIYIVPPRDGIWDFDFVGTAPTGIVLQVVLPVAASVVVRLPEWCKGVRVHAAQNTMEELVSKKESPYVEV